MTSYEILCRDLADIGIGPGDVLIVHSSLSSMGYVEGGAVTVIRALLDTLREDGTLLFPGFSYRTAYIDSTFSLLDTPVCVGKIPETFRTLPGVRRSFHPTHSVCGIGKFVEELLSDHALDDTPMGIHSPYRKLPAYNGKILMLGCSLSSNSFMHGMEEAAGVPYVLREHHVFRMTDGEGNTVEKGIRRHNFTRPEGTVYQRYIRTTDVLDESAGDYRRGKIHGADSVLLYTRVLEQKAIAKMKEDPYYFIDDPDGLLNK